MNLFGISALLAALGLDQRHAFQLALSQPLVTCSLIGIFSGNFADAMYFGLLIQLVWLGNLPVGASTTPEGNIASATGCLLYIEFSELFLPQSGFLILVIYVYTVFLSFIGGQLYNSARNLNIKLFDYAFKSINDTKRANIGKVITIALLIQFFLNWLFILISFFAGEQALSQMHGIFPNEWSTIWSFVEWAIFGAGIGLVISVYKSKKYKKLIAIVSIISIFIFRIV